MMVNLWDPSKIELWKYSTIQIGPFGKHNEFRLSGIIGGGGKARDFDAGENVAHIAFQFQYVDFV